MKRTLTPAEQLEKAVAALSRARIAYKVAERAYAKARELVEKSAEKASRA